MSGFVFGVGIFLIVIAFLLVHYRPTSCNAPTSTSAPTIEGFSVTPVDPLRMPACVARSADAQALLAQVAIFPATDSAAEELRLLVSKLCCFEADLATPTVGVFQTLNLQFRTSHDIEPPASLVARCRAGAVPTRDIEIIVNKFQVRGHALIDGLLGSGSSVCVSAHEHFDAVILRTHVALTSFCSTPASSSNIHHPSDPRAPGYWEPAEVSAIATYKGTFLDGDLTFRQVGSSSSSSQRLNDVNSKNK